MRRVGALFQERILDNSDEALALQKFSQNRDITVVDLTADDEQEQDETEKGTQDKAVQAQSDQSGQKAKKAMRNRLLGETHESEQTFQVNGTKYSVGNFVELVEPEAEYEVRRSTTLVGDNEEEAHVEMTEADFDIARSNSWRSRVSGFTKNPQM